MAATFGLSLCDFEHFMRQGNTEHEQVAEALSTQALSQIHRCAAHMCCKRISYYKSIQTGSAELSLQHHCILISSLIPRPEGTRLSYIQQCKCKVMTSALSTLSTSLKPSLFKSMYDMNLLVHLLYFICHYLLVYSCRFTQWKQFNLRLQVKNIHLHLHWWTSYHCHLEAKWGCDNTQCYTSADQTLSLSREGYLPDSAHH